MAARRSLCTRARRCKTPADFRGKKIATPQFGNTQDVAARAWLSAGGLKIAQTGGDAQVLPTANPDQLLLFKQNQIDAGMDGRTLGIASGARSRRRGSG